MISNHRERQCSGQTSAAPHSGAHSADHSAGNPALLLGPLCRLGLPGAPVLRSVMRKLDLGEGEACRTRAIPGGVRDPRNPG